MKEYNDAIEFLYTSMPMFQRVGASAYKPGLDTVKLLDEKFGTPHKNYLTIHIAGTNGKGSTAHTLAAILQSAGYRVGLYTSPHLVDFRERIRVNGRMISRDAVVDFVNRYRAMSLECYPSFFELTMTMAFEYFAREKVDIAVIETGLGGRLDSTNIIAPILSVITNISFDHTAFLGNTLESIASEKAGIIKPSVPVVIGEAQDSVREVFQQKADEQKAPIYFAEDVAPFDSIEPLQDGLLYKNTLYGDIIGELMGDCQPKNAATILTALPLLAECGIKVSAQSVKDGFAHVGSLTGLMGRWMTLHRNPHVVCDTGHNVGGWQYLSRRLKSIDGTLHMIIGFVNDKDVSHILEMMPKTARYYLTNAQIERAMPVAQLAEIATECGLVGEQFPSVEDAYNAALANASTEDTIFIGGSTFIVADLLTFLKERG
ncbi:MAG: bifunctional folylpolyglutamate synthase/dihydrofolate synthase [Muribaculaceae bacterium]|nr:bifunctional folylpolyglutamate synthase/dihydrofolate synthase [Muribaculaceae bacterium]